MKPKNSNANATPRRKKNSPRTTVGNGKEKDMAKKTEVTFDLELIDSFFAVLFGGNISAIQAVGQTMKEQAEDQFPEHFKRPDRR